MLKSLRSRDEIGPDVVTLVPFSGIQFIDFGFNADELRLSASFWESESAEPPQGPGVIGTDGSGRGAGGQGAWYVLRKLRTDPDSGLEVVPQTGESPPEDETYRINAARALEPFVGGWVPLPVLRRREPGPGGERFDIGPTNWARVQVVPLSAPDAQGNSHRVVLAIDTTLVPRSDIRGYPSPTREDSDREDEFALAHDFDRVSWFASMPWMREWLTRMFSEHIQRGGRGRQAKEASDRPCEPFARYAVFVELLQKALDLPALKLLDTLSDASSREFIPVDLVVDIGNSRTCGVLIEDQPGSDEIDLSQSYPLELRDLGLPCRVYSDPFESRIEFSRAEFGYAELNRGAGRGTAFNWGSLVRVGPEAVRLAGAAAGNEGATGMSSPKRYLWDKEEARLPWRFNGRSSETGALEPMVSGNLLRYLTDGGDVLSMRRRKERPAMTPLFSRSSLFTLMLAEILLQAISQINAPDVRGQRRHQNEPRRLGKVIMSLPPATPLPELKIMRERARAAVALVWDLLGAEAGDVLPPRPEIDPKWDEASATQLVYLFTEIKHNFKGDMSAFFRLMGRSRRGEESLRIASIDIGGGTSDLIVTTYTHESGRAITPKQEFRESFRLAGDDILRAVIEQQVMPAIQSALERDGLVNNTPLVANLFVGDRAGLSEQQRHRRRQFVNKVLMPVALALMHRTEEAGLGADLPLTTLAWRDVFTEETEPSPQILNYFDEPVSEALGREWSVRSVSFVLDSNAIADTVWGVIGDVLRLFGEAIHGLGCDVLLLSGRPSRLPAVQSLVLAQSAVPADRVVPMHHYPAGSWYPFRNSLGRIEDPKTTAVVGAALCELAGGQIQRFRMDSSQLRLKSTARYIGEMEQSGYIKNERLFFSDLDLDDPAPQGLSHEFQLLAPIEIGFRQLGIERWPATLLYRLGPSDRKDFQRHPPPWTCVIERADVDQDAEDSEEKKEIFGIEGATDKNGDDVPPSKVQLRLQTLQSEQGYWLDSGVLRLA